MSTIRYRWLAVIVLASGVVGWAVNTFLTDNGHPSAVLSPVALVAVAIVVAATLVLGFRVRSWRNGHRGRSLDPIAAARTVVLAQAIAYAGALLLGWHGGVFLDLLPLWSLRPGHGPTWAALGIGAGGIVMILAGLTVEQFCKLPPNDEDGPGIGQDPDPDSGNGNGGRYA